jgi:hypothetical protein
MGHQIGGCGEEMFTVVEQEQRLPGTEVASENLGNWPVWTRDDAPRAGDRSGDERRIIQRGQIDPGDAIREVLDDITGYRQGQPGLANAAGSGERQKGDGIVEEQCTSADTFVVAANKLGPWQRRVHWVERQCIGHGKSTVTEDGGNLAPCSSIDGIKIVCALNDTSKSESPA